jgi:hypothetical protein
VQLSNQVHELERRAGDKPDPALAAIRAEIVRELAALLPVAVRDARKQRPALLRLIVRAIRSL